MKSEIYSVYDMKAKIYGKPFYMVNEAVCLRSVTQSLCEGDSDLRHHPEDFLLYHMGTFDDQTCEISTGQPNLVCKLIELKPKAELKSV